MATGPVVNQGKGKFLREFLASHRDAKVEDVTAAWQAEGHDDGISESLVSKIRSELGLTGKKGSNGRATGDDGSKKAQSSQDGSKAKAKKSPESPPSPDDREEAKGPSRTAFVEELLGREPGANLKKVNEAWASAGHEGQISPSIYYKVKRERGGTSETSPVAPEKLGRESATGRPKAESEGHVTTEAGPVGGPSSSKPVGSPRSADREKVLDRVEDGIDDLIGELKQLGGMDVALEGLKKVRRVVVRSHEG